MNYLKFPLIILFIITSYSQNDILNIGHRGAKGYVAENTIESIQEAIRLGADGIEIDVFRCKSGEIVLFHDKTLEKLTNGKGKVENKTLTELKKLKVLDSQYSIPTLDEVLKSIGREIFLNIELKGSNTSLRSYELVKKYINQNKINPKNILFSSFNWKELEKLRKLSNDISIALITEDDPLLAINSAKELNAVAINPNFKDLNTEVIRKIKNAGFDIYTWTVNKREDIEKIKKLNVNGIITDYPDRF
jgi:glycerophosphoryl diester phosphodiesterase